MIESAQDFVRLRLLAGVCVDGTVPVTSDAVDFVKARDKAVAAAARAPAEGALRVLFKRYGILEDEDPRLLEPAWALACRVLNHESEV